MMGNLNDSTITVCYATDNRYAQHAAASIASLITSLDKERKLVIYVLHNGELSESHQYRLRKLRHLAPEGVVQIAIKAAGEAQILDLPLGKYPIEMYYRILLPRMLPRCARVIYLDCDTVVVNDISPLFDMDMEGAPFAAVPDIEAVKNCNHLGIEREGFRYCNSGVLLMDLMAMRHEGLDSQFVELAMANRELIEELPDQHALNLLMSQHACGFKYLGYEWNFFCKPPKHDFVSYKEVHTSCVLHLIAAPKPWCYSEEQHPFSKFYYSALRKTDYRMFEPIHKFSNFIFMLGVKCIYRPLKSLGLVGRE